jgi:DNA-binding HxlR family transcriptional regulator
MSPKRSYGDGCATAYALDLVGERWALLVVREMLLGPKRFNDLRTDLPGVSPTVLAQRLRELDQAGIVRRRRLPPPACVRIYELTDRGRALEPVVYALGRWAVTSPRMPMDAPLSNDATVLSMGVLFDPQAARGQTVRLNLRLGEHRFRVCVVDGRLDLARGMAECPDATVDTDVRTLGAVLRRTRMLADVLANGKFRIHGDAAAVHHLLVLFAPPLAASPSHQSRGMP